MPEPRKLSEAMKKSVAASQFFKCANKPGSNLKGIGAYVCLLWNKTDDNRGIFDGCGYHIDHIEEHSISGDDSRENLQALCISCHGFKTTEFMLLKGDKRKTRGPGKKPNANSSAKGKVASTNSKSHTRSKKGFRKPLPKDEYESESDEESDDESTNSEDDSDEKSDDESTNSEDDSNEESEDDSKDEIKDEPNVKSKKHSYSTTFKSIDDKYMCATLGSMAVPLMKSNGYFNASRICDVDQKQMKNWIKNNASKKVLKDIAIATKIPVPMLTIQICGGNFIPIRGTYVHPLVAENVAYWCGFETYTMTQTLINDYKLYSKSK